MMKIGMMCGEHWYRFSSWRAYSRPFSARQVNAYGRCIGFRIGPILFWDGS